VELTDADAAYICANYVPLEEAVRGAIDRGLLPQPSYVLDDGTEMVPADYFGLLLEPNVPARFAERYLAAGGRQEELDDDWAGYIDGVYGVCLRVVTPETIVRKGILVESLTHLLDDPKPGEPDWRASLRAQVEELDSLEREFSPDYDRVRFGRPPTRDLLITAARERFPELVS